MATPAEERLEPEALLRAMPPGLRGALAASGAATTGGWREGERHYVLAGGRGERLFARFSAAREDAAVLAHEVAARAALPASGPLRSPAVRAHGRGWLLERHVDALPLEGPERIAQAVEAAEAIAPLILPRAPLAGAHGGGAGLLRRLVDRARFPLPLRDVLRARRILSSTRLDRVTSHGDFHPGNVLAASDGVWVVDWELAGPRPWGHDLMQLWTTLEREEDRAVLLERALALAGPRRDELLRLRYAVLVRTIAAKLGAAHAFNRDEAGAGRLLALLPATRRDARL